MGRTNGRPNEKKGLPLFFVVGSVSLLHLLVFGTLFTYEILVVLDSQVFFGVFIADRAVMLVVAIEADPAVFTVVVFTFNVFVFQ